MQNLIQTKIMKKFLIFVVPQVLIIFIIFFLNFIKLVSLFIHLWGGEGCQVLFESESLDRLVLLLSLGSVRNQRLILKSIRKGVQIHLCAEKVSQHSAITDEIGRFCAGSSSCSDSKDLHAIATEILHYLE